jgi:hypothetical protein
VANQFQTTADALFGANQGGYPFTTGQVINVPKTFNYGSPAAPTTGQNRFNRTPYTPPPVIGGVGQGATVNPTLTNRQIYKDVNAGFPTTFQGVSRGEGQATSMQDVLDVKLQQLATGEIDMSSLPLSDQDALFKQMQDAGVIPPGLSFADFKSGNAPGALGTPTRDSQGNYAPNGVNASGERLDSEGNVWDPATAKRDIYGGQFIQVGQVKWEKNRHGRLVKVQYLGGGKKRVVKGGKNQGGVNDRPKAQAEVQQQNFTSFGVVNFGAGSG